MNNAGAFEAIDYNRYLHKFELLNSEPDFKAIQQKEGYAKIIKTTNIHLNLYII
jgi:hypothetical protein